MSDPDVSRTRRRPWTRRARMAAFAWFVVVPMAIAVTFTVWFWAITAIDVARSCTCTCRGPDAAR